MRMVFLLAAWLPLTSLLACPTVDCAENADCPDGSFCTDDGDGPTCARGCAADLPCAQGQACIARDDGSFEGACLATGSDNAIGTPCTDDRDCASGTCLGEEGSRICVAGCQVGGGACPDPDERCTLDGLRYVCVAPLDARAADEPCASSRECSSGTCIVPPDADDDQASCQEACADDLPCGAAAEVCVRLDAGGRACLTPLNDGAACQASSACQGGFCVLDIDQQTKCASACASGACAAGFGCQSVADEQGNDLCLPVLDTRQSSEPCTSARECVSGHCARFATADADLGTLCADPCSADGECAAPLVCWADPTGTDVCGPQP